MSLWKLQSLMPAAVTPSMAAGPAFNTRATVHWISSAVWESSTTSIPPSDMVRGGIASTTRLTQPGSKGKPSLSRSGGLATSFSARRATRSISIALFVAIRLSVDRFDLLSHLANRPLERLATPHEFPVLILRPTIRHRLQVQGALGNQDLAQARQCGIGVSHVRAARLGSLRCQSEGGSPRRRTSLAGIAPCAGSGRTVARWAA